MINIKKYKMEFWMIGLFFAAYVAFCYYLVPECMHQAWFSHFDLLQSWFDQTLTWRDVVSAYSGEHGMLGYNLLLLVNTKFFQLNTRFDTFINDICVLGIGILAFYHLRRWKKTGRDFLYFAASLVVCLSAFGLHQLSSASMETQVRMGLLFSALIAHMSNHCLVEGCEKRYLTWTVVVIVLGINVFGTLYSFALFPVLFLFAVVQMIRARKPLLPQMIISVTCVAVTVLYCLEYQVLNGTMSVGGGLLSGILHLIMDPVYIIKSLFAYNAGGLLGYAVYADEYIPHTAYLLIGAMMTVVILFALVLYFKRKMYLKTAFPLLLIGYSFVTYVMIIVGRYTATAGAYMWTASYWYTCHLKLQIIGVILIFMQYWRDFCTEKSTDTVSAHTDSSSRAGFAIAAYAALLLMGIGLVIGNCGELKRAPSERAWNLDKQMWMFADDEDEMPMDENGSCPLLYDREQVMRAIGLMKEHSLSVYRYYNSYLQLMTTVGKDENGGVLPVRKISGSYDDGWLEQNSTFAVHSGAEGLLSITLYQPNETYQSMAGQITINDEIHHFTLSGDLTILEYSVEPNALLDVTISMDQVIETDNGDMRDLSVLLSDLTCT